MRTCSTEDWHGTNPLKILPDGLKKRLNFFLVHAAHGAVVKAGVEGNFFSDKGRRCVGICGFFIRKFNLTHHESFKQTGKMVEFKDKPLL